MRKIPKSALRKHMVDDTKGFSPKLFETYATIAAQAALHDGVYCHKDDFLADEHCEELLRRGFIAYDAKGNVIVPGVRKLIPTIFNA